MQADPYSVAIEIDDSYVAEVDSAAIEALVSHVLRGEGVAPPAEVSLWITDESEVQRLNREYRSLDAPTDVLSFGAEEDDAPFVAAPDQPRYLGDLAISFPHVARQAEEYGHSRQRELGYLVTHGLLHLLGYDHEQPDDARRMREREEVLLGALGITRDESAER
jgi:probable rRNA maturation factor